MAGISQLLLVAAVEIQPAQLLASDDGTPSSMHPSNWVDLVLKGSRRGC